MKKLLTLLCFTITTMAYGQKLIIGSQAPVIKDIKWLSGVYNPKVGNVILFYQAGNSSCIEQYEVLKQIVSQGKASGVVITRDVDVDGDALSDGGKIAVGYDDDGDIFKAYGVKYLPFALAVGKDEKVTWIGALRQ